MNSPYSGGTHPRHGAARELLTAALLGLALMATMTTLWWDAMR